MTRRAAVLIVAASVALPAARAAERQQPVFKTGVDAVSVPVSVRRANLPIAGLTAKDFELTDNGVAQTISAFTLEALPIDVTLLMHVSRSIEGSRLEWLKASVAETYGKLKPDDRLRLIAVQHMLREIVPFQARGTKPVLDTVKAAGGTSLYDALATAMMHASEPERRQLIVAFTTGVDTISILDQKSTEAVAGLADAVVHLVVPVGGSAAMRKAAMADAAPVSALVARTGGQTFQTDIDKPIGGAFTQALEEFRTSYVLRYVPAGVKRDGWHEIVVTVKGGPYDVRARKGYGG